MLANPSRVNLVLVKMWALKLKHNKALKWDLARVAFSVCVEFGGYGTVRSLLHCVPAPLNAALCNRREKDHNLLIIKLFLCLVIF
ncbi:hypothetical protein EXA15_16840 [Vibrio cincinnatiensis]|nr:hypothetical protein [Vibrio cincinnatiensis]